MKKILYKILSVIIVIMFLVPILYTVIQSFIDENHMGFSLHQYFNIAFNSEYFFLYFNSIFISLGIIVGQLIVSIGAAYYFARKKSKLANAIFILYIFLMLLPLQITLIPNMFLYNGIEKYIGIKIRDTYLAVVLPGIFSTMGVFFLKQFFETIPKSLYEMANIDGASDFKILISIVIPYSKNAILALCALNFIESWNIVEQALVFIDTQTKYPLSLYLNTMYETDRSIFYAGNVVFLFPVICLLMKNIESIKKMISKEQGR